MLAVDVPSVFCLSWFDVKCYQEDHPCGVCLHSTARPCNYKASSRTFLSLGKPIRAWVQLQLQRVITRSSCLLHCMHVIACVVWPLLFCRHSRFHGVDQTHRVFSCWASCVLFPGSRLHITLISEPRMGITPLQNASLEI